jgi:transposase
MSKPLADGDTFRRIEIITGTGRRRRWSETVKAAIVAEALEEGAVVSEIARRHQVASSQVFAWRRQAREQALAAQSISFAPVIIDQQQAQAWSPPPPLPREAIEIDIDGARLRIPPDASRETIFAVIEAALGPARRRR